LINLGRWYQLKQKDNANACSLRWPQVTLKGASKVVEIVLDNRGKKSVRQHDLSTDGEPSAWVRTKITLSCPLPICQ
jgi:hypothetical protein